MVWGLNNIKQPWQCSVRWSCWNPGDVAHFSRCAGMTGAGLLKPDRSTCNGQRFQVTPQVSVAEGTGGSFKQSSQQGDVQIGRLIEEAVIVQADAADAGQCDV